MDQGRVETHRDLDVWKRSIALVEVVYDATKRFPDDERFGLVSQMRRSAVSAPSNIAEGASRSGRRQFIHFLRIARSSLAELETQCIIARNLGYLDPATQILDDIGRIQRMLNKLIGRLSCREAWR